MHEVLANRLGGLSLPRKSVVRLTDRLDMTLGVYYGRKTTIQQQQLAIKRRQLKQLGHYAPHKKESHGTMLSLISLNTQRTLPVRKTYTPKNLHPRIFAVSARDVIVWCTTPDTTATM